LLSSNTVKNASTSPEGHAVQMYMVWDLKTSHQESTFIKLWLTSKLQTRLDFFKRIKNKVL